MGIPNGENVQYAYLSDAKEKQVSVTIYMMNGFQVKGRIIDFDRFTILVESYGKKKLLYKSAVSTIEPDGQEPDMQKGKFGYSMY